MSDYFVKTQSFEITFCASYCKNVECSRNTRGELFGLAMARPYYSSAKLAEKCKSYIGSDK